MSISRYRELTKLHEGLISRKQDLLDLYELSDDADFILSQLQAELSIAQAAYADYLAQKAEIRAKYGKSYRQPAAQLNKDIAKQHGFVYPISVYCAILEQLVPQAQEEADKWSSLYDIAHDQLWAVLGPIESEMALIQSSQSIAA